MLSVPSHSLHIYLSTALTSLGRGPCVSMICEKRFVDPISTKGFELNELERSLVNVPLRSAGNV